MTNQEPVSISLYEFYTVCLTHIHDKAPWEKAPKVTKYHQSFITEERLLAMSLLYLLGEDFIPASVLNTMAPQYREQVRDSVNQAVFARALRHHFRNHADPKDLATKTLLRMESYISIIRDAEANNEDPLEATTFTLAKRVPPHSKDQLDYYSDSVEQTINYVEELVSNLLKTSYTITEL